MTASWVNARGDLGRDHGNSHRQTTELAGRNADGDNWRIKGHLHTGQDWLNNIEKFKALGATAPKIAEIQAVNLAAATTGVVLASMQRPPSQLFLTNHWSKR